MFKIFKNLISAIIFFIFLLEIVAYSLAKFDNTEIFNIRSFTEKTNDKRLYTLKKIFFQKKQSLMVLIKKIGKFIHLKMVSELEKITKLN